MTSLGNLCQYFTTLIIKKFFLTAYLNQPSSSLKPSALVAGIFMCIPLFLACPTSLDGQRDSGLAKQSQCKCAKLVRDKLMLPKHVKDHKNLQMQSI